MSWRTVVVSSSSKLDYHMGYLVIRNEKTTKIHLGEMETLIIESTATSLTAVLLCELVKQKIKVIFCDEKRNPISELLSYRCSHDSSAKIRKQIEWSDEIKSNIWTEIVAEKIRNQARHLEKWNLEESRILHEYVKEMKPGDASNREGHAAKVYFNALFGKEFTRSSENSINAALNYGYSILLSSFNREICANGYLTQIGLFHDNMFNPFNLASDLMEPYRTIIDYKVKIMKPEKFEKEEKENILTVLQNEVIISGRKELISNAIKIYCKSVFDAINEKDSALLKFYRNEL